MAPWEELAYLDLPDIFSVVNPGSTGVLLCPADPMRAILILSAGISSGVGSTSVPVSPGQAVASKGIFLASGIPLILNTHDTPGLVQAAWFVNSTGTFTITAVSISFIKWPSDTPPYYRQRLQDAQIRSMMGEQGDGQ